LLWTFSSYVRYGIFYIVFYSRENLTSSKHKMLRSRTLRRIQTPKLTSKTNDENKRRNQRRKQTSKLNVKNKRRNQTTKTNVEIKRRNQTSKWHFWQYSNFYWGLTPITIILYLFVDVFCRHCLDQVFWLFEIVMECFLFFISFLMIHSNNWHVHN
jgi:hypothetical protein